MRITLISLVSLLPLAAGELIVITLAEDQAFPMIQSLATGDATDNPEPELTQEEQVAIFTFRDLKAGKYRVSYSSIEPFGFSEDLMEIPVVVGEKSSNTVYFFHPQQDKQLMLPVDVEEFLSKHPRNLLELTVVYDGSDISFVQARGGAWAINYLRDDCEYKLRVWNHSYQEFPEHAKERKIIYEKKFRTVLREIDPFSPGGITDESLKKANKSEQATPSKPSD